MAENLITIAAIADLHLEKGDDIAQFQEQVEDMAAHADLIAVGGDIVDRGSIKGARIAAKGFAASSVPVVAVLGNHDRNRELPDRVREILEGEGGIHILDNNSFSIGQDKQALTIFGTTGIAPYHRGKITNAWQISDAEFDRMMDQNNRQIRTGVRRLKGVNNIILSHFKPVSTINGSAELYNNPYGNLYDAEERYLQAIYYGHDHYTTSPLQTEGGLDLINIAKHVNITMEPGTEYRLIPFSLEPGFSTDSDLPWRVEE